MLFDDLLNNPAKWMVESRDEHDIVLTSRIRLAPVSYTHLDVYKRQVLCGAVRTHAFRRGLPGGASARRPDLARRLT